MVVSAQWHSITRVDCVVPRLVHAARRVFVELSWNALQYVTSHVTFDYFQAGTVAYLEPVRVPTTGGTQPQRS